MSENKNKEIIENIENDTKVNLKISHQEFITNL